MSPSWISQPQDAQVMDYKPSSPPSRGILHHSKRFWFILIGVLLALAIGLGVGLGVGLTQGSGSGSGSGSSPSSSPSSTPSPIPPTNTSGIWQPAAGSTWQIVLLYPLNDTSLDVDVYDIDLFDNPVSTITNLHSQNRKVICYFSAGSYEANRPDSANFTSADKGKELDGWPGEYWLNISSPNVRSIMTSRLKLAKEKGCDGVDPDNIDGYDNENGLGLSEEDSISYLAFLADSAHALNLSIGLKNGGAIVNETIDAMQWEVNEQCVQYQECDTYRPFIDAGKPVFHIEYPKDSPDISVQEKTNVCDDSSASGFSTVLKNMDLDDFVETC